MKTATAPANAGFARGPGCKPAPANFVMSAWVPANAKPVTAPESWMWTMDDADRVTALSETTDKVNLYCSHRDEPNAHYTGYCLFCDEPVDHPRRWCNAQCRDDWEKEQ